MRWACLLDNAVVLVLVPVEAKLTDPFKVVGIGAAHLAKLFYYISGMHLNGDESHHLQQANYDELVVDCKSVCAEACMSSCMQRTGQGELSTYLVSQTFSHMVTSNTMQTQ